MERFFGRQTGDTEHLGIYESFTLLGFFFRQKGETLYSSYLIDATKEPDQSVKFAIAASIHQRKIPADLDEDQVRERLRAVALEEAKKRIAVRKYEDDEIILQTLDV